MKNIFKTITVLAAASVLAASCSKILEEQPRSFYEPGFFKTEAGVTGGLTSLYASLRYLYGQGYYFNINETGTDEATYAESADGNFKDADLSGVGTLTPSSSRSDVLWGQAFSAINTASGIIENAAEAGLPASLIAEAQFFRAFYYFQLVQTFGGVPLDLGAGELKFNSLPTRTSVRNTVADVYTKAIFVDLEAAISSLPDAGRVTGGVTKTAARLLLAKAYLTYAWWLENPGAVPTYPECNRNASEAPSYYQKAYDMALAAINNPGPFGLMDNFYMVSDGAHDRNKEILLYADHTQDDEYYNASSLSWSNGNAPENFVGWFMQWNYSGNLTAVGNVSGRKNPVQREAVQFLGRPWTRMCPTQEALYTFLDNLPEKDSRFDGTFTWIYRANWQKGGLSDEYFEGANGMKIYKNEPVLTFLFHDDDNIDYSNAVALNGIGAGELPGRADFVIDPQGVSRVCYPGLWKQGTYRTDHDQATSLGSPNGASTRPFNVMKFSELYLVAAEAAVKGATGSMSARDLLNVLRARAGKWSYKNNEGVAFSADYSADLTAATPSVITVDYVLDERLRELYGEGLRWFDLVRTQTWEKRAGSYTICSSTKGDHDAKKYSRNIEKYHYLRPIPQSQLDGLEMGETEKASYQNPGYPTE